MSSNIANQKYYDYLILPSIALTLISNNTHLTNIIFGKENIAEKKPNCLKNHSLPILHIAKEQLTEYFTNKRKNFTIPYLLLGTAFQKEMWENLKNIPYGETLSYESFAKESNKHIRPLSANLGRNPLPIILPCHRVIGKNNTLTGFNRSKSGDSLNLKQYLLQLENSNNLQ